MRERGFTLIELMIVVAIIAVIAAIAIPSLMGARIGSNEAVASACLRTYAGAQNMYRRSDWDDDLIFEYATPFTVLNTQKDKLGNTIKLIDDSFANAAKGGSGPAAKELPKAGYLFLDITQDAGSTETYKSTAGDLVAGYGLCAAPHSYGKTGRQTFVINIQGTVYQRDLTNNTGVTVFPNTTADKWATTGG